MVIALGALAVGLSGCGTTPAKEFGGRWKPVNHFSEVPVEIPLYSDYVFQASPLDRTLKAMLERWTKDVGMKLDFRMNSDFTLHNDVRHIRTTSVSQAAEQLAVAYSANAVIVSISGNSLVVSTAGSQTQ